MKADTPYVLIADDNPTFIQVLSLTVRQAMPNVAIVSCDSLPCMLERVRADGPYTLILLDLNMPGMSLEEGLQAAIDAARPTPVAVVSGDSSPGTIQSVARSGAGGFLGKTMDVEAMVSAIASMARGERFFPMPQVLHSAVIDGDGSIGFTPQERRMLPMIAAGQNIDQIAEQLGITPVTGRVMVRRVLRKLSVETPEQVADALLRLGIQAPEAG